MLQERQFEKMHKDNCVLELDLSRTLEYKIPDEYLISSQEFLMDKWQYQLVIHKMCYHLICVLLLQAPLKA